MSPPRPRLEATRNHTPVGCHRRDAGKRSRSKTPPPGARFPTARKTTLAMAIFARRQRDARKRSPSEALSSAPFPASAGRRATAHRTPRPLVASCSFRLSGTDRTISRVIKAASCRNRVGSSLESVLDINSQQLAREQQKTHESGQVLDKVSVLCEGGRGLAAIVTMEDDGLEATKHR